ncbi:MAG: imidazoleglycerol-phosphate dehydratase HisB [Clostridia bacterium]|nr:imidazoleglycerol-phosphate dehydratase HisB [Clostridia bacterium]
MRTSSIARKTAETDIRLSICLDKYEDASIDTGCGFFDHMLTLFAKHSGFTLNVSCVGDIKVDYHHSIEDIGICLGEALKEALGDCKGICRYGNMILPMDEALVLCALDISGRSYLVYGLDIPAEKIGDFDSELVEEFFVALTRSAGITLHLKQLDGRNSHHIAEAAFKSFARALRQAVAIDEKNKDEIPSTKGVL